MNDKKIRLLYVCPVCDKWYGKKENAEKCLSSHDDDTAAAQIALSGSHEGYDFTDHKYRHRNDWPQLDTSIHTHSTDYPCFGVSCLDTPSEILAAKKRLIKAAYEWADKYKEVLTRLEQQLEKKK